MSDATSGNARATPRPSTAPTAAAAATAEQRADMVTPADFATFSAAVETGSGRCDTAAEVNEAISGRMYMFEHYQYSAPERISKTSRAQTISDQRLHPEKLGRQQ